MKSSLVSGLIISLFFQVSNADSRRPYFNSSLKHSAARSPHSDYKYYFNKHTRLNKKLFKNNDSSAAESAVGLEKLDTSIVKNAVEPILAMLGFQYGRDRRFIEDKNHKDFLRRSTWLYPDDGCWARAELLRLNFKNVTRQDTYKVFAFGDLSASTPNSPEGDVSWWYHVAPLIKVQDELYVLDPALSPQHPLLLQKWLSLMGDMNSIKVAICMPETYGPSHSCLNPTENNLKDTIVDQGFYLEREWQRLIELDRDPLKELGEHPPWGLKFMLKTKQPYLSLQSDFQY